MNVLKSFKMWLMARREARFQRALNKAVVTRQNVTPTRMVYYIDVGTLSSSERLLIIQQWKEALRRKQVV